jgi:hypothetical protein
MVQNYMSERARIFSEDGVKVILEVERTARAHIASAGAVRSGKLLSGDSWMCLNAMDYLCEHGVLHEVTGPGVAGQDRVFVAGGNFSH